MRVTEMIMFVRLFNSRSTDGGWIVDETYTFIILNTCVCRHRKRSLGFPSVIVHVHTSVVSRYTYVEIIIIIIIIITYR